MKKTKLTKEKVIHIAQLAKLELNEEEVAKFQKQLSDIIDFVDQLSTMDTANVLPTSQVTGVVNVFRQDEVNPSLTLTQKEALSNAPKQHQGFFVVKSIFN